MKKLYFVLVALLTLVSTTLWSQSTSLTAVNITAAAWSGSAPTVTNYCLTAGTAQTAQACGGAATDVYWFRFTLPGTVKSSAVKINVIPTGFDAVIDFYAGTTAAPIYRECSNTGASGAAETLKTTYATNPIVPGTEYLFRVSSTTDVAALCFNLSLEYYPNCEVRSGFYPNPNPDDTFVGYRVNQNVPRSVPVPASVPTLVQATRFRFVESSLPLNAAGCSYDINSSFGEVTLRNLSCICYGFSYRVYVEIRVDNHWCGEGIPRTITMEAFPNTTITTANCASLGFGSNVDAAFLANTAVFEWEFSQGSTVVSTVQTAAGVTQLPLSSVPCLRYNRVYSVRIRVRYCNSWGSWSVPYCIITVPFPTITIASPTCGSTINFFATLGSTFVSGITEYITRIYRINPGAPTVPIAPAITQTSTSNFLSLSPLGLAPGGTYVIQVRGRRTNCGIVQEGDFGPLCTFTIAGGAGMETTDDTELQNIEEYIAPQTNEDLGFSIETNTTGKVAVFSYSNQQRILTMNIGETALAGQGQLKVYNMGGQLVHESRMAISPEEELYQTTLPTDLPPGVYIVSFVSNQGSSSEKFVLN